MDAAQRRLCDQIDDATQRLLGTARVIAEPDLRQPSLLPGWTRAHVLAHLARGADAMRTILIGARSGEDRPAYASAEAREADIERSAAQQAKELMADVADSAMALRTIDRQLPDQAWARPVRLLGLGAVSGWAAADPRGWPRSSCIIATWPRDTARLTGRPLSRPWNSPSRCGRNARTGAAGPRSCWTACPRPVPRACRDSQEKALALWSPDR